ncbi:MAG: molybdenum cofactor guanylyltransferase [Chloroflexi bacterium]|nr:molybdenum cofactor guanylyltransferase [Chloroflexota bacterium]
MSNTTGLPTHLTGAVLAGGMSRRLGRDKALLELGGLTLLERAIATLGSLADEVIVIGPEGRASFAAGARVVPDAYPTAGPLGGIATALEAATTDRVLIVACDMPFLSPDLLIYLRDLAPDADLTIPRANGQTEQMHAIYSRACLPSIHAQIATGDLKIDRFFSHVQVRYVEDAELRTIDPALRSFFNINTLADLELAMHMLSE